MCASLEREKITFSAILLVIFQKSFDFFNKGEYVSACYVRHSQK